MATVLSNGCPVNRPSWDEYWLNLLPWLALRSTCLRKGRQAAAIIVVDDQIVTTGYNGAPRKLKHCEELGGCLRDREGIKSGTHQERCRAVHAEQNAIIQAAVQGRSISGGTLYTTMQPCVLCSRTIINARIERVVFTTTYPDDLGLDMLQEALIEVLGVKDGNVFYQSTFTTL